MLDLFGGSEKPSAKIKLTPVKPKAPARTTELPEVKLEAYVPPKPKAQEEVKEKKEVRLNKVSNESVPPFHSEEERLSKFPNHPPKKPTRQRQEVVEPEVIEVKKRSNKEEFRYGLEQGMSEKVQETFWQLMEKRGLSAWDARDVIDDLVNRGIYEKPKR